MDILIIIFFLIFTCLYMSWNIGSNDLANAMGTIVGSGSLNLYQVIFIASIFELIGAISIGNNVTTTLSSDIIPLYKIFIQSDTLLIYGMISSLLTSSILITLATFYKLPVSTSHSIVSSILGFGIYCIFKGYLSFHEIYWSKLIYIIIGWFFSPIMGFLISFLIYFFMNIIFIKNNFSKNIKKKLSYLQIISSCLISLSHGSNDVSNSIFPIKSLILVFGTTSLFYKRNCSKIIGYPFCMFFSHYWNIILLIIGAFGMIIGFITYGKKIIQTIGHDIINLNSLTGFIVEIATAIVVLLNSIIAFPVSTTHVLIGSIIGVGITNKKKNINKKILKRIFISWVITIPFSIIITMLILVIFIKFSSFVLML